MRITGDQTIYSCDEHGEVGVPVRELMRNGELTIYPEIAGRGYFNITYARGVLTLRASKYVGLIPISENVAIHVRPKVPIENLLWLVWRAEGEFQALEGVLRTYQLDSKPVDDAESMYVRVFVAALQAIHDRSLLKRYESRSITNAWRGRLSIARSVQRHYSRGIHYRHDFVVTELTQDTAANRIVKHTALRLLRHLAMASGGVEAELAARMRRLLEPLAHVDESTVDDAFVARNVPRLLRALPGSHQYYAPALWLAYLVATRSGVLMERVGRAQFESLLINLPDVFERYVRRLCVEAQHKRLRCVVRDGNVRPLRLFVRGVRATVRPDMYFTRRGSILLVADAKYKDAPDRDDRQELMAHCEAACTTKGAFICPKASSDHVSGHYGTTPGQRRVDLLRIDLAAPDMHAEESRFVADIENLLS